MPLFFPVQLPSGGGSSAGQLYAYQSGGGVVTLVNGGGIQDALTNVDVVDGSYIPDSGGLVSFDTTTHRLTVLQDALLQIFIAPSWGNPGVGAGGVINFTVRSDSAARFFWSYNFNIITNPTIPQASGTPPIYPSMLFLAGDVIRVDAIFYGGTTTQLDITYIDLAVTALAVS